jgi:heptaprenylglyceryl phosphate synthase
MDLPRYLPLFDPDSFHEPSFFAELARIGYEMVLLGGTGNAHMKTAIEAVRASGMSAVIHPSSPGDVWPADLALLPAVMNSDSHFAGPFGSGAVMSAMAIAQHGIPFLPVAYFVMAESTAAWYANAVPLRSRKLLVACCKYAQMIGYRHLLLDYEGAAEVPLDGALSAAIKCDPLARLLLIARFTPHTARTALAAGVDTVISASNVYEEAADPLELARTFHEALQVEAAPQVVPPAIVRLADRVGSSVTAARADAPQWDEFRGRVSRELQQASKR